MACSGDSETFRDVSLQDDSFYAFQKSHEALVKKYNELKSEYRKVSQSKTCCHCAAEIQRRTVQLPDRIHFDASRAVQNDSICQPSSSHDIISCHLPETDDSIRNITSLCERLSRVLSNPNSDSDHSSLNCIVASLCEQLRQMPFSPDAKIEAREHSVTNSGSSKTSVYRNSALKPPSCRTHEEDFNNVEDEINLLISIVSQHNEELKTVHQALHELSVVLKNFVSTRSDDASGNHIKTDYDIGGELFDLEEDDWSVYIPKD